ncbi:4Fe-4S dicluster domain-containing protein [Candidatus Aerophobetes bacterium]|nr:4Fe-4S dicluster domain-containing protein [Candidatus Aerophobetes bacterium]
MAEPQVKIIRLSELDLNFKYEIQKEPGGENITRCFACGSCTNACPIREIDEKYNPRKIIHMALLGMKDEVFKSEFVWLCSSHYTCFERCPQGVNIGAIASAVRSIAIKEGFYPDPQDSSWNEQEVIEFDELDQELKYKVAAEEGGENISRCFACGSCTAMCPERERDERYNPRKFIRMIILGMKKEVFQSDFLWLCSTHYRCAQRCPQGVNIKEIMNAIKNIATGEGYTSPL